MLSIYDHNKEKIEPYCQHIYLLFSNFYGRICMHTIYLVMALSWGEVISLPHIFLCSRHPLLAIHYSLFMPLDNGIAFNGLIVISDLNLLAPK